MSTRISFILPVCGLAFMLTGFEIDKPVPKKSKKHYASEKKASPSSRLPESSFRIVIDKSDYEMKIYDEEGWLATYPVVFGNKSLGDKRMEGDRMTPEGTFRISFKKYHKEWGCFLLLDYPNKESYQKFNQRKALGQVPKNARIGGGIGIHGTRPREEYAVDKYMNWTNGCISVKYSDIFELYDLLPVGTLVIIQQ